MTRYGQGGISGPVRCRICVDEPVRRAVDEELEQDHSATYVARLMTHRGHRMTEHLVRTHARHRVPVANPKTRPNSKDLAIYVRDKVYDELEKREITPQPEGAPPVSILDPIVQPAISTGLRAQSLLDARMKTDKNVKIALFQLLLGGRDGQNALAPLELVEGDDPDAGEAIFGAEDGVNGVFEGEAVELDGA